jgi:hypothetical protein
MKASNFDVQLIFSAAACQWRKIFSTVLCKKYTALFLFHQNNYFCRKSNRYNSFKTGPATAFSNGASGLSSIFSMPIIAGTPAVAQRNEKIRAPICISVSIFFRVPDYFSAQENEGPAGTGWVAALPGDISYNSLICTKQFPA